jgi:hypothetical protein
MAKALQCPSCKYRHKLEKNRFTATFSCLACGKKLKLPQSLIEEYAKPDSELVVVNSRTSPKIRRSSKKVEEKVNKKPKQKRHWGYKIGVFLIWLVSMPLSIYLAYKILVSPIVRLENSDFIHIVTGPTYSKYILLVIFITLWSFIWAIFVTVFSIPLKRLEERKNAV